MEGYVRKFGKLIRGLSIPVDDDMHSEVNQAKAAGFEFNDWARDLLHKHWDQVLAHANKKGAGAED